MLTFVIPYGCIGQNDKLYLGSRPNDGRIDVHMNCWIVIVWNLVIGQRVLISMLLPEN